MGFNLSVAFQVEENEHLSTEQSSSSRPDNISTEPSKEALEKLKKYFGHNSFRPLQWQVISNALKKRDQLVVISTG